MVWLEQARAAYRCPDPVRKCALTAAIARPEHGLESDGLGLEPGPGRPCRPELVHPAQVPRRRLGSLPGRIALVHAVAHIEFNAINLALDAALRYPDMPLDFYRDWISVAQDEARHHRMMAARLTELGATYGDCPAHNGLWEMAEKTAPDPLLRMALVPRVLEARGLDVTPGMIERLHQVGDEATAACLRVILDEEVRHVEIGTRWFEYLCRERGLDSAATFISLLKAHGVAGGANLNLEARRRAGFSDAELQGLGAPPE